ncbi:hypothetical protein HRR83_008099 [Exophiala dermatitidis]|uniref:Uncharacterized protein n=1 Tax=Exophiala dermatitidis TaxID=5970 RepID=A0AAN6ISQ2_EXODE|nr:hypothetical protein HRR74_008849 [Exophiala dermatitidis]KAJ4513529.1 hypothetical protein HRR73_005687 [Exophiala dermatitidis]KAJ4535693.1 hypothetical protein HRR77_007641 [Exophiala dermatitidis]KAJ4544555.1 hypothetical protein HRR76_002610 [Exophiala dermatitidis]KAJ4561381.1 hypothetical protein HRR79_007214 [Exophiala dermatitidis]
MGLQEPMDSMALKPLSMLRRGLNARISQSISCLILAKRHLPLINDRFGHIRKHVRNLNVAKPSFGPFGPLPVDLNAAGFRGAIEAKCSLWKLTDLPWSSRGL